MVQPVSAGSAYGLCPTLAWPVTWPAPLKSRYVTWGALQVLYAFPLCLYLLTPLSAATSLLPMVYLFVLCRYRYRRVCSEQRRLSPSCWVHKHRWWLLVFLQIRIHRKWIRLLRLFGTDSYAIVYHQRSKRYAILCCAKTSRLGRRKCQSTIMAPNSIVSVKSTLK